MIARYLYFRYDVYDIHSRRSFNASLLVQSRVSRPVISRALNLFRTDRQNQSRTPFTGIREGQGARLGRRQITVVRILPYRKNDDENWYLKLYARRSVVFQHELRINIVMQHLDTRTLLISRHLIKNGCSLVFLTSLSLMR